jgi:hypothetical protein
MASDPRVCIPKLPPPHRWKELAKQAKAARADNVPDIDLDNIVTTRGRLAVDIKLRWPKSGVKLTVSFLDNPNADLRRKILTRMNAWNKTANVQFTETTADPNNADVRIARVENDGHWSYLGVDIKNYPGEPTMNLDGFTSQTPDSELDRVVPHETGHTLGFPHEHLRRELVGLLDRQKTIEYYMRTQGWEREDVIAQLLTPPEDGSIEATARPDVHSIMCYEIPGECTKDGKPIIGGTVIDEVDYQFAAKVYPKSHKGGKRKDSR